MPSFLLDIDKTLFMTFIKQIFELGNPKVDNFLHFLATFQQKFNEEGIGAFIQFHNDLSNFLRDNKLLPKKSAISNQNDSTTPETLIIQELQKPPKLVAFDYSNATGYNEFCELMIDNFYLSIFESSIKEIALKMIHKIKTFDKSLSEQIQRQVPP